MNQTNKKSEREHWMLCNELSVIIGIDGDINAHPTGWAARFPWRQLPSLGHSHWSQWGWQDGTLEPRNGQENHGRSRGSSYQGMAIKLWWRGLWYLFVTFSIHHWFVFALLFGMVFRLFGMVSRLFDSRSVVLQASILMMLLSTLVFI